MKKIIALVGLVALMAGFTACTKTQTELSSNAISTKVQVYGFIEVATGNGDNDEFTGTADFNITANDAYMGAWNSIPPARPKPEKDKKMVIDIINIINDYSVVAVGGVKCVKKQHKR